MYTLVVVMMAEQHKPRRVVQVDVTTFSHLFLFSSEELSSNLALSVVTCVDTICRYLLSKDRRSWQGSASCWTGRFRFHHVERRHIIFICLSNGFGDSFSLPLSPSEYLQTQVTQNRKWDIQVISNADAFESYLQVCPHGVPVMFAGLTCYGQIGRSHTGV